MAAFIKQHKPTSWGKKRKSAGELREEVRDSGEVEQATPETQVASETAPLETTTLPCFGSGGMIRDGTQVDMLELDSEDTISEVRDELELVKPVENKCSYLNSGQHLESTGPAQVADGKDSYLTSGQSLESAIFSPDLENACNQATEQESELKTLVQDVVNPRGMEKAFEGPSSKVISERQSDSANSPMCEGIRFIIDLSKRAVPEGHQSNQHETAWKRALIQ